MNVILILDVGTSNIRGILFNLDGEIIFKKSLSNLPIYETTENVIQDPLNYCDKMIEIAKICVEYCNENNLNIEAISTTALRSCVMLVKDDGTPLSDFIMWQDKRSSVVSDRLSKHVKTIYEHTGDRLSPVFTAPKMTWLKENMPDAYNEADRFATIADYLHFAMTDVWATDYTYGSRTSIMNINNMTWDDEMLSLFNIDKEKLCELIPQGSIIGRTTEEFSIKTGIKTGIPVVTAGGDQQCGALGNGVISQGNASITTGTGAYIIASSNNPILDEEMSFLCNASAVPGLYNMESSMLSAAVLYEWFFKGFYDGENINMNDTINQEASKSPVGSNDLIVLPYFAGRGSPDWNHKATGGFLNVSLNNDRGDFARAILEGIAMETATNLNNIQCHVGKLSPVYLGGGLTRFELFNQIQADTCDCTITLQNDNETTARGAFYSALVSIDYAASYEEVVSNSIDILYSQKRMFQPIDENVKVYNRLEREREKIYQALQKAELE